MNEQDVQDTIKRFTDLLHSKELISAEKWSDMGGDIQILMYHVSILRLASRIAAKKKLREIRKSFTSNIDAKDEWETTDEWKAWQENDDLFESLKGFKVTANNEANVRKANNL